MSISVKVNTKGARKKIAGIRRRLQPGAKVYKNLSKVGLQSTVKNFNSAGRDPVWPPRQKEYSHPPLDKTGRMRDTAESSWGTWEHTGDRHTIKILSPSYGKYHQYGTSKLPIRKFVKWLQSEIEAGKVIIRKAVNG